MQGKPVNACGAGYQCTTLPATNRRNLVEGKYLYGYFTAAQVYYRSGCVTRAWMSIRLEVINGKGFYESRAGGASKMNIFVS